MLFRSLVFSVTEGAGDLKVSFVGDSGTTLLVISDGQTVICDPSAPVVLTPELTLQDPSPGHYGVWVARANVQRPINGLLTVSFAQ